MSALKPKVYLAAPFFNPEQIAFVDALEPLIKDAGYNLFSPRDTDNARKMNAVLQRREAPTDELRLDVFNDNWGNIDDADLMVAVIDNFDAGTVWEIGYGFARHLPIITITNHDYGCNLMLAHSIIGHVKSLDELKDALELANPRIGFDQKAEDWAAAVAEIQSKYKSSFALVEGPGERDQD